MNISKELQQLLDAPDHATFTAELAKSFIADASKRNPDVTNERMLKALALPKYNEAIKSLNKEIESLKIINRRTAE